MLKLPYQWVKNLFVFLPLFFNATANNLYQLILCIYTFFSFSLVASAIYCINDAVDVNEDRMHPEKSKRPVASGKVSIQTAILSATLLFAGGMYIQFITNLNISVMIATLFYTIINIAYVFKLKQIAIIGLRKKVLKR